MIQTPKMKTLHEHPVLRTYKGHDLRKRYVPRFILTKHQTSRRDTHAHRVITSHHLIATIPSGQNTIAPHFNSLKTVSTHPREVKINLGIRTFLHNSLMLAAMHDNSHDTSSDLKAGAQRDASAPHLSALSTGNIVLASISILRYW
jgi:hypothetical protein